MLRPRLALLAIFGALSAASSAHATRGQLMEIRPEMVDGLWKMTRTVCLNGEKPRIVIDDEQTSSTVHFNTQLGKKTVHSKVEGCEVKSQFDVVIDRNRLVHSNGKAIESNCVPGKKPIVTEAREHVWPVEIHLQSSGALELAVKVPAEQAACSNRSQEGGLLIFSKVPLL